MFKMKILIACEESQIECIAFRNKGHEAYSCDIKECTGGHKEWHIQEDAAKVIKSNWDMIIAHPPCTYVSNAGARWLYKNGRLCEERFEKGLKAKQFFELFLNADCSKVCVENPLPSKIFMFPEPTQIIQPYYFGEPYSKRTCLWLKGLPPLMYTLIDYDFIPYVTSGKYSYCKDKKYKGVSRKGGSSTIRSKSFKGIAAAMANQW